MGLTNMQKDDFKWYSDNFDDLYKRYGKSFVVISDKKVLDSYPTEAKGVHSMDNKNIEFIVKNVLLLKKNEYYKQRRFCNK